MFVRKRRNRSGSTSVVVIDKSSGRQKELVCIGISSDTPEIEELVYKGKEWIMRHGGQSVLDFDGVEESFARVDEMLDNIESAAINGTKLILNRVYDKVGFNTITDDVLRNLVIARICQPGFSKDGKTSESQIILGLLVSAGGYPLSYAVFNGSQYEGRTMIPIIDDFKQRFNLKDFVVVADSGLMSKSNVKLLKEAGYKYIIGARLRNESDPVKDWVLSLNKEDGRIFERNCDKNERLIVGYSAKRAAKEAHNREQGVEKLRKRYATGSLTKDKLNKHGYNKFLEISKDVQVVINQDKVDLDARWDGLKGYRTNTNLSVQTIIEQYHGLWVVEKAFRISKGNLEMRPIFHFTEKRIEAHICICFVAYKVYKELERIIQEIKLNMSVDKVLDIAKTLITLQVKIPGTNRVRTRTLFLTPEHQSLLPLFKYLGIYSQNG